VRWLGRRTWCRQTHDDPHTPIMQAKSKGSNTTAVKNNIHSANR
jgi:hypothetical protein